MHRSQKHAQLTCEQLEQRRLLASDLSGFSGSQVTFEYEAGPNIEVTQKAGDLSYWADGREVPIAIHPSRLAITTPSSRFGAEKLPGDLELVRNIGDGVSVFESKTLSSSELERSLLMFPGIPETSFVFTIEETKTEAAILDEVIVALEPGAQPQDLLNEFPQVAAFERLPGTTDQFVVSLSGSVGLETLEWTNQISNSQLVSWATPNFYQDWQRFYTPNDPLFGNQWHLDNTGQGGGVPDEDPDLPEAWDLVQGGSANIVIGVYDDGVANDHPDINNWVNEAEANGTPFGDDDGNGWLNDLNGWNFVNDNASSFPTNATDNHGTAVAGVAAAIGDNAVGVAGASYGSPVIAGRLFDGANVASDANIAAGIYYLAGRTADGNGTWDAADVVNNSWGGGGPSTAISSALTWATTTAKNGVGVPYIFATGNGGADFVSYPAVYSSTIPGVVAVGAHNNFGERSGYSQYGPDVDLVTPSNGGSLAIETTDRVGAAGYNTTSDYTGTGASGFGGTSSASPLATGITALLLARAETLGISLSASEVRELLRANTDLIGAEGNYDVDSGKDYEFGYGRLNAASLVNSLGKAEISVTSTTEDLSSGSSSANFGQIVLGQTAQTILRIRNQGSEVLTISGISSNSGEFSVDSSATQMSLGVGEATTFIVNAAPTTGGTQTGSISITSNDADEGTFEFDVVAEVAIPSVAGTVFEDSNADGAHETGESGLPAFVVFLDENGNDSFDTSDHAFEFTTQTDIPDTSSVTTSLEVSGLQGNLFDLDVGINITHTFDSDLIGTLIAPDGTRIVLFNRVGGGGNNFTDTVFDDSAANSINDGSAPFTGSFRPEDPLSTFTGDPNGTWQLEVSDNAGADTGTLDNWSLSISMGEATARVDALGQFALLDLPVGDHTVRVLPSPGGDWPTVSPANGEQNFTINQPTDSYIGRDFGVARNDRFYAQIIEDTNGDGVPDTGEASLPDWDVFVDLNNNGAYDAPAMSSFVNTDDVAITDNSTAISQITASGVDAVIADIDVRLEATHTFTADLEVTLVSPDGTRILLFADEGGAGDNLTGTILDDEADETIAGAMAPFTGRFIPENSLSGFDGQDANGTWTLEVFDDAGGDTGTLLEWELMITAVGDEAATSNEGGLVHLDLTAGAHNLHLIGAPLWEFTVPANGVAMVTANGTPLTGHVFGTRPIDGEMGDIIVDTVWDDTSKPYRLIGDVRVRDGATLTIANGVTVETLAPEFELQIGTDTEVGNLNVGEAAINVGLLIQPTSTADLDETTLSGDEVEVLGTLSASEVVFGANLLTSPGSTASIRFSEFSADKTFVFDSGATLSIIHNDFTGASPNSVQALGAPATSISMMGNWWGTSDATAIGEFILDQLDDNSRPLMDISEPLVVQPTLGDANGDGILTNGDIAGFVLALTNPAEFATTYPNVDPDIILDMNWSGRLTNADIAGFRDKLTGN